MRKSIRNSAAACTLGAALIIGATEVSLAQVVVVSPYGPYHGGPYVAVPYGGYPYRNHAWDYPAGYDTGGAPYYYRDLGWHPLNPVGANPCYPGLRAQNRC